MIVLARVRERCRLSFWLLPGLMGGFAVFLALGLLWLDWRYADLLAISSLGQVELTTFSSTLSTLLAAIVTIFGIILPLTFSILLRASSQFSPMVLRSYRTALQPKVFLGGMFATTLYLMVVVIAINHFGFQEPPTLTMVIGFSLILLTIYSIPAFFHHFVASIEPSHLAASITRDLREMLHQYEYVDETGALASLEGQQERSLLDSRQYRFSVRAPMSGYIQSIHYQALVKVCAEVNGFGVVPVRPGAYVLEGTPLFMHDLEVLQEEKWVARLQNAYGIGEWRAGIADLELLLDELVAIILRALSPGVTDLATARQAISCVGSACNLLLNRRLHSGNHKGDRGEQRLFSKEFDFYGFAHAAFDRIRQNATSQPAIVLHVLEMIRQLVSNCRSQQRGEVLKEIADELVQEFEGERPSIDREKLRAILERIDETAH